MAQGTVIEPPVHEYSFQVILKSSLGVEWKMDCWSQLGPP